MFSFLDSRSLILRAQVEKLRVQSNRQFEILIAPQAKTVNIGDIDQKTITDEHGKDDTIQGMLLPQQVEVTEVVNNDRTTLDYLEVAPDIVSSEEAINSNILKRSSRKRSVQNSANVATKSSKMAIEIPFQAKLTSLSEKTQSKKSKSKNELHLMQISCGHNDQRENASVEYRQSETEKEKLNEAQSDSVSKSQSTAIPENTASDICFKLITSNVYSKALKLKLTSSPDVMSCKCIPDCNTSCLNRQSKFECTEKICLNGEECKNRPIQQQMNAQIEVFQTDQKGFGVRSTRTIEKGVFIMEYVGEIISMTEYQERAKTIYKNDKHSYGVKLEKGFVIDARNMGNISRYVNHACSPNCELEKWNVDGIPRLALFAKRRIQAGEELTYHYQFKEFGLSAQQCYCNTSGCKKFIDPRSERTTVGYKIPKIRIHRGSDSEQDQDREYIHDAVDKYVVKDTPKSSRKPIYSRIDVNKRSNEYMNKHGYMEDAAGYYNVERYQNRSHSSHPYRHRLGRTIMSSMMSPYHTYKNEPNWRSQKEHIQHHAQHTTRQVRSQMVVQEIRRYNF